jgi:hypothetical protein
MDRHRGKAEKKLLRTRLFKPTLESCSCIRQKRGYVCVCMYTSVSHRIV